MFDGISIVSKSDFYMNCCCICGNNKNVCIDLLAHSKEDYLNKIRNLLPINIDTNDNLPKKLCHICIVTLNDFDNLRQSCIKTQLTLENLDFRSSDDQENETIIDNAFPAVASSPENYQPSVERADEFSGLQPPALQYESISKDTFADDHSNLSNNKEFEQNSNNNVELLSEKNTSESSKLKGWTIQHIPEKNTTLYMCDKCNVMLLYESATKSHCCRTSTPSTLVTHILPSYNRNNSDQNEVKKCQNKIKNNKNDANVNGCKKKRKRIYFGGDD